MAKQPTIDDPFADIPDDDDPFADIPHELTSTPATTSEKAKRVVDPDMPHTTAEHWNGTSGWPGMKQRAQHASNASYQRSVSEDEENRPVSDDVAAAILGAGNAADSLGLADEFRGYYGGAGAALGTLAGGGSLDDVKRNAREAYEQGRDQQREATRQAEENSPMASAGGQTAGLVIPAGLSIAAKAPQLAAQAITKAPSLVGTLAKAAGIGSLFGAASGAGHGEGGVDDQLKSTAQGGISGALLGAAGAALPAFTMKLAPKASVLPASQGLRAAPSEAARTVGVAAAKTGRSAAAAALDAAAAGVSKAPLAGGAAIGGKLGGPVGAGVGGIVGTKLFGAQADALSSRIGNKAAALRAKNTPPSLVDALQPLAGDVGPPASADRSGLELDTAKVNVDRALAALKRRMANENAGDVSLSDILREQAASNPWAASLADALEGKAPSTPSSQSPPPLPSSALAEGLADAAQLRGRGWMLSADDFRTGRVPPSVAKVLRDIADNAAKAEPSTTSDASGAAGFDELGSPALEEGNNPSSWPLPDTDAARRGPRAPQPGPTPAPPAAAEQPSTAVMANPQLGRLRLQASRENPASSPWSDALDAAEAPVFTPAGGTELRNPAIREGWRAAAARHAAPVEGGPESTASMTDDDVAALLGRGGRTKGGLQGSSAYFPKRNALLQEQASDAGADPSIHDSALELLATSRTAPKASPADAFDEPLPSFVTKSADELGLKGFEDQRSSTWKAREEGEGVLSAGAKKQSQAMSNRHARADRLPSDRASLLQELLEANKVGDHDSARADAAYRAWKAGNRKGPKPSANLGGMLDAFNTSKEGTPASSLLEAFERETRGMKTWRELADSGALDALAQALGVDEVRVPDSVLQRRLTQDLERGE